MAELTFIVYSTDADVSSSLGNEDCAGSKPAISLVYDDDGARGEFGRITCVIKNPDMVYLQVMLKYNTTFDWATSGEVTLGGIDLLEDDKVYLAGQTTSSENGIYIVKTGAWVFDQVVDDDLYVDLGARAFDTDTGDLTRNIITDHSAVDFDEIGFHSIYYYVVNECCGRLSKTYRKVKVITDGASIMPTNSFKITHYEICSAFDEALAL
jgi:hypothetical protein